MYGQKEMQSLVKMIEQEILRFGKEAGVRVAETFALGTWKEAFVTAEKR